MRVKTLFTYIILLLLLRCNPVVEKNEANNKAEAEKEIDFSKYVNTFVGTDGPGNTYPGAVSPFGMVQLSPDNGLPGWDRIAGYFWADSTIAGFSHSHLSGTGAGDMYDLLVMPMNSRFTESLTKEGAYRPYSKFSHSEEEACAGYYKVKLKSSGIIAELTTTERVGIHRYTFPADSSKIILDLGYALNWDKPTDTKIIKEDSITISGYRKSTGWAKDQRVFFVAKFSKPFDYCELYENNKLSEDSVRGESTKFIANYKTKENEKIILKVALSSASIEGARKSMKAEASGWDFDKKVSNSKKKWNEVLSKIKIEGTEEQKSLFYTNLYHCFLTPSLLSDLDGKAKGADGNVNQMPEGKKRYDTFSLWDTFRAAHPLYTIICPAEVEDFIHSFMAHYDETGLLPVWSLAGNETNMMIGYHAVAVVVDAYLKGINLDVEKAYEACVASANEKGRGIEEYKKYGYLPYTDEKEDWSVSKTLEYAFDDWCIAQFAKALHKDTDADYFLKRSNNWRNLYDKSTNFFRAKTAAGSFVEPFYAKRYTNAYCESNAWQYFWSVQHDIKGLIALVGKKRFAQKLDSMFTYYPLATDTLPIFSTGIIGQYMHGNEPSHHVAYLYNYLNQPQKTAKLVHRIINTQYNLTPNGFCGNEDCGQMSAWLVFSAMGLYPVNPASGIYDITVPWLNKAELTLPNGKVFTITTKNKTPSSTALKAIYLNGKAYRQLTITHQQILQGGNLCFEFGKGETINN